MSDIITLTGIVATPPRHVVTAKGLAVTSFRLASGQRRFDRAQNTWVDADTNWYTVSMFRHLAFNVGASVEKGQHVIVSGRVRIRNWQKDERTGTTVEVEADSVGHDLTWCTTTYTRKSPTALAAPATNQEPQEFPEDDPGSDIADDGFLPRDPQPLATLDS